MERKTLTRKQVLEYLKQGAHIQYNEWYEMYGCTYELWYYDEFKGVVRCDTFNKLYKELEIAKRCRKSDFKKMYYPTYDYQGKLQKRSK